MQAVILCGGRGNRLRPLTDTVPKPLIKVAGREILRSPIEELLDLGISDIIFVVKYLAHEIQSFVQNNYVGRFRFVHQIDIQGTGAAIYSAKEHISENFFMLYGDNIFAKGSIRNLYSAPGDGTVGVVASKEPERYGCVELDNNGNVSKIVEKPLVPASNLVVLGGYRFPPSMMHCLSTIPLSARGEMEVTDAVNLSIKSGQTYSCSPLDGTIDIASFRDIERYEIEVLSGARFA